MTMTLQQLVAQNRSAFAPMFHPALTAENTIYMELSDTGRFAEMSEAEIDAAVFREIEQAGAVAGVGGYLYIKMKGVKPASKKNQPDPDADYHDEDEDTLQLPEDDGDEDEEVDVNEDYEAESDDEPV